MHERAFVLIPLLEIAPAIAHPATGKPVFGGSCCPMTVVLYLWKKINGVEHFLQ